MLAKQAQVIMFKQSSNISIVRRKATEISTWVLRSRSSNGLHPESFVIQTQPKRLRCRIEELVTYS
jgi:hypothetical protein